MNNIILYILLEIVLINGGALGKQAAASEGLPMNVAVDLYGAHRVVFESAGFKEWYKEFGLRDWHESVDEKRRRVIVAESRRDSSVWAGTVSGEKEREVILARAKFDVRHSRGRVLKVVRKMATSKGLIRFIRPEVRFGIKPKIFWEAEIVRGNLATLYRLGGGRQVKTVATRKLDLTEDGAPKCIYQGPPSDDALAENEIHHPSFFKAEAESWTSGSQKILEKAQNIFDGVTNGYTYSSSTQGIKEFSWSDYLVAKVNNKSGICDELAIVAISYLRALNIRARLKILNMEFQGKDVGHAALEFFDENKTVHYMDPVYGFDDPCMYTRRYGFKNIRVADADEPNDAMSVTDVGGLPDLNGDCKLNPYGDFKLDWSNNPRPAYNCK